MQGGKKTKTDVEEFPSLVGETRIICKSPVGKKQKPGVPVRGYRDEGVLSERDEMKFRQGL